MANPIIEFKIKEKTDPVYASYKSIKIAEKIGFSKTKCQEVGIIISELGTNIIKYGVEGTITIYAIEENNGLKINAMDKGNGISDITLALKDNYTDQGPIYTKNGERTSRNSGSGSGSGLAAIKRLSDQLKIVSNDNGTMVECIVYS